MKLKPIMFVGTCSDAGKSILSTAFCRIFRQDGYTPAPFKAQNMSLNSYCTPEGGEIGRAQAVQAEACGIAPHTDMNPVLLKPNSYINSQVIVNGHPIGNMSAQEYFATHNTSLFPKAIASFQRLAANYNPIVLEGAGSISELNLKDRDITNMRMAEEADAATYLVADIDRGGVFASVYGSIELLPFRERDLIKGIIINKFRGDINLFKEGREMLQKLTGIPVVGVIPYFTDIQIEQEDSVALDTKATTAAQGKINIAILLLKHLSNFTDFDVLEKDKRFHPYYTNDIDELNKADIIILPGSKNTLDDMQKLRETGIAEAIIQAAHNGKKIIGICGGYQMLGTRIDDPQHIEGNLENIAGLGLLPLITTLTCEKTTEQRYFKFNNTEENCRGYEIHMGQTTLLPNTPEQPLNTLENGEKEGYRANENLWGTYMHGILDNTVVRDDLAAGFNTPDVPAFDYIAFKEQQYDLLAERVREAVDLSYIYASMYPELY
ncbi:cobyric acid synthase [Odoribacter lunatus]|uniref:cobyric acid synthase n=1 Tax=Odoribacter lunatus TaxID=2941335 RepID=UPI00203C3160|nr:cobyric acid synthase [Odoribacter lunatus]